MYFSFCAKMESKNKYIVLCVWMLFTMLNAKSGLNEISELGTIGNVRGSDGWEWVSVQVERYWGLLNWKLFLPIVYIPGPQEWPPYNIISPRRAEDWWAKIENYIVIEGIECVEGRKIDKWRGYSLWWGWMLFDFWRVGGVIGSNFKWM